VGTGKCTNVPGDLVVLLERPYADRMSRKLQLFAVVISLICAVAATAAPKARVISFGKWTSVKLEAGLPLRGTPELRIRGLFVDTRLKEYTTGMPHEVTDRLFVVQRIFRLNDTLPDEGGGAPRWQWQRGGWLLVDRGTGRVSAITLPEFDPFLSTASWYRDYVAYCGVSDDGKRLSAVVAQLGRRKAILKKPLGEAGGDNAPDSVCPAPGWQRQPSRVTFEPDNGPKVTFAVRGHAVDVVVDDEEGEAASK
jgi:hypothetical protein